MDYADEQLEKFKRVAEQFFEACTKEHCTLMDGIAIAVLIKQLIYEHMRGEW